MKFIALVLLLVVHTVSACHPCKKSCPEFWTMLDGVCYRPFGASKKWVDAEQTCYEMYNAAGTRGHLASIHSAKENNFVHQLWKTATGGRDSAYWIGLNDRVSESLFVWSDDTKVDYTSWDKGEPNNSFGEDCVVGLRKTALSWNDKDCDHKFSFVCKIPAVYP